jgi:DNA repair exonuclease SbcCD ATPase subunit
MIIQSLKLHNWITIAEADVKLGAEPFLVTGENRDELSAQSNGAGKSLLSQSIVWVLFDDILRNGMKKDQVIGKNDSWTSVNIVLTKDGKTYDITRYRKHPEFGSRVDILEDGKDESEHKTKSVAERLGIRESTVYYCAYSHSGTQPIVAFTPAKFTEAVSEILEIERFDKYIKETRKVLREAQFNRGEAVKDVAITEANLLGNKNAVADLKERISSFYDVQRGKISGLTLDISELAKTMKGYQDILDGAAGLEEKMDALSDEVDKVEELNGRQKKLKLALDKSRQRENTHQKALGTITGAFNEADAAYNNIANNPSGYCSYCGSSMGESKTLEEILREIEDKRDVLQVKKISAEVDLSVAKKDSADSLKKIGIIDTELVELQKSVAEYNKLAKKSAVIEKAQFAYDRVSDKLTDAELKLIEEKARTPEDLEQLHVAAIQKFEDTKEELVKDKALLKKQVSDLEAASLLEEILKAMKSDIVNDFVVSFSEELQENLDEMTDGDYQVNLGVSKGQFSFTFTQNSKEGIDLPFSLFSDGERARIAKATSTALEAILDIGFVIDDEGIAGVDPAGIDSILSFILKKNDGKTFIFTSHDPSVKDFFNGAKNIHITKEGGVSTVEVRQI